MKSSTRRDNGEGSSSLLSVFDFDDEDSKLSSTLVRRKSAGKQKHSLEHDLATTTTATTSNNNHDACSSRKPAPDTTAKGVDTHISMNETPKLLNEHLVNTDIGIDVPNLLTSCPLCNKCFSEETSLKDKEIHINGCLDGDSDRQNSVADKENKSNEWKIHDEKKTQKKIVKKGAAKTKTTKSTNSEFTCPICRKFHANDKKKFISHLKICAAKHKLTTSKLMNLVKDVDKVNMSDMEKIAANNHKTRKSKGKKNDSSLQKFHEEWKIKIVEAMKELHENNLHLSTVSRNQIMDKNMSNHSSLGSSTCDTVEEGSESSKNSTKLSNTKCKLWNLSSSKKESNASCFYLKELCTDLNEESNENIECESFKTTEDVDNDLVNKVQPEDVNDANESIMKPEMMVINNCITSVKENDEGVNKIGDNKADVSPLLNSTTSLQILGKDMNNDLEENFELTDPNLNVATKTGVDKPVMNSCIRPISDEVSHSGFIPEIPSDQINDLEIKAKENLLKNLESLLQSSFQSDVVLHCKDGIDVRAHSLILHMRCKDIDFIDEKNEANIHDISSVVVHDVLRYIYTGTIPTSDYNQVYKLAGKFGLDLLKEICLSCKPELIYDDSAVETDHCADEVMKSFFEANISRNIERNEFVCSPKVEKLIDEDAHMDSCFSDDEIDQMQKVFQTQIITDCSQKTDKNFVEKFSSDEIKDCKDTNKASQSVLKNDSNFFDENKSLNIDVQSDFNKDIGGSDAVLAADSDSDETLDLESPVPEINDEVDRVDKSANSSKLNLELEDDEINQPRQASYIEGMQEDAVPYDLDSSMHIDPMLDLKSTIMSSKLGKSPDSKCKQITDDNNKTVEASESILSNDGQENNELTETQGTSIVDLTSCSPIAQSLGTPLLPTTEGDTSLNSDYNENNITCIPLDIAEDTLIDEFAYEKLKDFLHSSEHKSESNNEEHIKKDVDNETHSVQITPILKMQSIDNIEVDILDRSNTNCLQAQTEKEPVLSQDIDFQIDKEVNSNKNNATTPCALRTKFKSHSLENNYLNESDEFMHTSRMLRKKRSGKIYKQNKMEGQRTRNSTLSKKDVESLDKKKNVTKQICQDVLSDNSSDDLSIRKVKTSLLHDKVTKSIARLTKRPKSTSSAESLSNNEDGKFVQSCVKVKRKKARKMNRAYTLKDGTSSSDESINEENEASNSKLTLCMTDPVNTRSRKRTDQHLINTSCSSTSKATPWLSASPSKKPKSRVVKKPPKKKKKCDFKDLVAKESSVKTIQDTSSSAESVLETYDKKECIKSDCSDLDSVSHSDEFEYPISKKKSASNISPCSTVSKLRNGICDISNTTVKDVEVTSSEPVDLPKPLSGEPNEDVTDITSNTNNNDVLKNLSSNNLDDQPVFPDETMTGAFIMDDFVDDVQNDEMDCGVEALQTSDFDVGIKNDTKNCDKNEQSLVDISLPLRDVSRDGKQKGMICSTPANASFHRNSPIGDTSINLPNTPLDSVNISTKTASPANELNGSLFNVMTTPTQEKTNSFFVKACKEFGAGSSIHPVTNEPITPMPHYSVLPTPELKDKMKSMALRDLPKHKMVAKMKEVYKFQHNFIHWEEEGKKPKGKRGKKNAVNLKKNVVSNKEKESDEERISDASSDSESASTLNEQLLSYIMKKCDVHYKVLSFQPLEFNELLLQLKSNKIKCSKKALEGFLDTQCICYFTAKDDGQQSKGRKGRGTKKKK